jgi:hypothetical protein
MSYDPFKCPDCKVWWRGETHMCAVPKITVTINEHKDYPDKHIPHDGGFVIKPWGFARYCKFCGVKLSSTDKTGLIQGTCPKHAKGIKDGWKNNPPNWNA